MLLCYFIYFQLQKRYRYKNDISYKMDAIEELKNSFEIAERASPGIGDQFLREIIHKLVPSLSEQRISIMVDHMIGIIVFFIRTTHKYWYHIIILC